MIYWECTDPGTDAANRHRSTIDSPARARHRTGLQLRRRDGRTDSPSAAEITEFLSVSRRAGALGASFWVWQEATPEEWAAVSGSPWSPVGTRPTLCRVSPR